MNGIPYRKIKDIFSGDRVVGAGETITSDPIPVGDGEGSMCIEVYAESVSPDHELTFQYFRSNGDWTEDAAEDTIEAAFTGQKLSAAFSPAYMSYIVVKCSNAAGKEDATVYCDLVRKK